VATNGYLKVAVVLGAVALLPLAACSSDGEKTSVGDTVTRAATGDVATNGGARRENGDQSQAIRDAIASAGAKNVIMLLGDGMGDSEITVARNYVKGNPQKTILELAKDQGFATGDITTSEIQDATPAALFSHITERDCYGPEETAKDCTKEALENGGLGSVTEQLLTVRPDITWAAAQRPSVRRRTAASTRARPSRCRPRSAASRSSAPQANWTASARPIRTRR